MPSPTCQVKNGAAAYVATDGGVDVTPGATIIIKLTDTSANSWSISCITTDELSVAATITAALTIDPVALTATFTAPIAGRAYRLRSQVNGGIGPDGRAVAAYATTFCIYTLAADGGRVIAADETTEGNSTFGYIVPINNALRNIATATSVLANAATGTLNDVVSTDSAGVVGTIRFSGVAPTVNGIASGATNRRLFVLATGGPVILANEAGASTAANRIVTGTGASITIANGSGAELVYDATSSRWRLVGDGAGVVYAAGIAAWLADPTSAKLATAVTDETGTGGLVFATSPTLTTPAIGPSGFYVWDAADAFKYTIVGGGAGLAANRTLYLPVTTGTDTVAVLSLAQTLDAKTLTGVVSAAFGALPASTGPIRLSNATTAYARNAANDDDVALIGIDASNDVYVGGLSGTKQSRQTVMVGGQFLLFNVAGTAHHVFSTSAAAFGLPVIGESSRNSPYGVHGGATHAFAADASYVVTAAQYALQRLQFTTGSWGSGHTVTWPHPASLAAGYGKTIINLTAYTMTVSTGTGTTRTLATNLGQRFWFDSNGVENDGATFTP